MEHWNEVEEAFKELAELTGDMRFLEKNTHFHRCEESQVDKKDLDDTYTMDEIFNEIYEERFEEPKKSKNKLNAMFEALFDCEFKDVLVKGKKGYVVGENGKTLIKFLVRTRSTSIGRKLLGEEYHSIDFQVENMLFCIVSMFFEELDKQDGSGEKRNKTSSELLGIMMEKFGLDIGTLKLRKSIAEFNYWMGKLVQDDELKPYHEDIAKKIDEFAMYLYD